MTFWDHLKPAPRPPVATHVEVSADQKTLTLTWNDGATTRITGQTLRAACPCAECVEEWSGRRTFDPASIDPEMKILEVSPVGNYALSFTFGDAHRIGIFHWTSLREMSTPPARS